MKNNKKNKELDELSKLIHSMSQVTSMIIWTIKIRKFITEIVGSIFGAIWASTLLMYILTDNKFYLKVFVGLIAIGLIIYFIIMILASIGKRKREEYIESLDMASLDKPSPNDINNDLFTDEVPIKYLVTDKNDSMYNKTLFLYPVYGRLNPNKTITFFRKEQITPITDIKIKDN